MGKNTYDSLKKKVFNLSGCLENEIVELFDIDKDVNAFLEEQKITLNESIKYMIRAHILVDLMYEGYLYYINHKASIIKTRVQSYMDYLYWKKSGFPDTEAKKLACI